MTKAVSRNLKHGHGRKSMCACAYVCECMWWEGVKNKVEQKRGCRINRIRTFSEFKTKQNQFLNICKYLVSPRN